MIVKTFIALGFRGVGALSLFMLTIFVARTLPMEESGKYFLVFSLLTVLAPICVFGTHVTSLKLISIEYHKKNWPKILGTCITTLVWVLTAGGIASIILFKFAGVISNNVFSQSGYMETIRAMAPALIFMASSIVIAHHLQAFGRTVSSIFILSICIPLITSILILIFQPDESVVVSKFLAISAFITTITGITLILLKSHKTGPIHPDYRVIFFTSLPICGFAVCTAIINWGAQIIAGNWVDASTIAQLNIAIRVSISVSAILIAINLVISPKIAVYYESGDLIKLNRLIQKSVRFSLVVSTPLFLLLCVYPEMILKLFGNQYTSASNLLTILACAQFVNVASGSCIQLLNLSGRQLSMLRIAVFSAAITVLLSLVLVSKYGVVGAAIAAASGVAAQNLLAAYTIHKKMGINIFKLLLHK